MAGSASFADKMGRWPVTATHGEVHVLSDLFLLPGIGAAMALRSRHTDPSRKR
jgi:hypothetical protein